MREPPLKIAVFVAAALVSAAPAQAACGGGPKWLWSPTSAGVNRSTQALATGRPAAAADLAARALAAGGTAADARIAHHNLCIVSVGDGADPAADPHCRAALAGAAATQVVCNAALFSRGDARASANLAAIIESNIARAAQRGTLAPQIAAVP